MMSSVIPARLTFQCGHAALVTLPRVKGETSAQRNERVAREKSAALQRQCDFCGPAVEVALPSNGSHIPAVGDVLVAEPIVVSETAATAEPVQEAEAAPAEPEVSTEAVVAAEPQPALNGSVHQKRRRRRAAHALVTTVSSRAAHTYRVEYQLQRVIRATDIRDALRKAGALGNGEVLAVTRED